MRRNSRNTGDSVKVAIGVAIALLAGTLVWCSEDEPEGCSRLAEVADRPDVGLSVAPASVDAEAPSAEQRLAVPEARCIVHVVDEAGGAVAEAMAFEVLASFPPKFADAVAAVSVHSGYIEVPASKCPASGCVTIWADGFAPLVASGIESGATVSVVLAREHIARMRVVTGDGFPVAGYGIAVTRADAGTDARNSWNANVFRPRSAGGNEGRAASDKHGMIVVRGIEKGRYYLRTNTNGLPYADRNVPVILDVPGPDLDLVVEEYWAVVFRSVDDQVIANCSFSTGPSPTFLSATSAYDYRLCKKLSDDLRHEYPGASIHVGLPTVATSVRKAVEIEVCTKCGGWSTHDVPAVPITLVSGVFPIACNPTGAQSGRARVLAHDGRDVPVSLEGAMVGFEFKRGDKRAYVRAPLGEFVDLPMGDYRMYSTGSLPFGAFSDVLGRVSEPVDFDIRVAVRDMYRYRVTPRLANGRSPSRWGIYLGGSMREHQSAATDSFMFLSLSAEVPVRVFVQGYEPKTELLSAGGLSAREGVISVDVVMGEPK